MSWLPGLIDRGLSVADPSSRYVGRKANWAAADLLGLKDGPAPAPPPAPPTINEAEVAAQSATDELRRRRGMASTILAGAMPAAQPTTRAAALLGS